MTTSSGTGLIITLVNLICLHRSKVYAAKIICSNKLSMKENITSASEFFFSYNSSPFINDKEIMIKTKSQVCKSTIFC